MPVLAGFEHICREREPLASYNWFRLGGLAQYFAEPTSADELCALVAACHKASLPVRILGGGSNVLVRDEGVTGMVIHLSAAAFAQISVSGKRLTAGGGAKLGHVISDAVRHGLAGLQHLVGIPGTIGGALRTNASTLGGEIGQTVLQATVLNRSGQKLVRSKDELRFGYRDSNLGELVILEAVFELEPGNAQQLMKAMQQSWIVKRASQPWGEQGTGQLFKDLGSTPAAALIEDAGLKSLRVGDVEISDRHANFVVVGTRARSRDVLELMETVQREVSARTGVSLEPAIEVW